MMEQPAGHRLALGLATLSVAVSLTEHETDDRGHARRQTVLAEKWALLRDTFPHDLRALQGYGGTGPSLRQVRDALAAVVRPWSPAARHLLVIDLLQADAFAPYGLRVDAEPLRAAVTQVADVARLYEDEIGGTLAAWQDAHRTHRWSPFRLLRAAPIDPATEMPASAFAGDRTPTAAHDLALLGGGSLAIHDPRLAGGLWLLRPADLDASDPAHVPAPSLLELPVGHLRSELTALQISHEVVIRAGLLVGVGEADVVAGLVAAESRLEDALVVERGRNDDDAPRVRSLDDKRQAVRVARGGIGREQLRVA